MQCTREHNKYIRFVAQNGDQKALPPSAHISGLVDSSPKAADLIAKAIDIHEMLILSVKPGGR